MNNLIYRQWLVPFIVSLLLSGCGGGGGGYAGIDGSGDKVSITGPINAFGSVVINGVHYNTDHAKIFVRGEPASEYDLNVGDYVTLITGVNSAGARVVEEVRYQPRVTGTIESIDRDRSRFVVLGQSVQLLGDTIYSSQIMPRNIEGLHVGQVVSVSGVTDAEQVIRATRVERDFVAFEELAGVIRTLNPETFEFTIGGQPVRAPNHVLGLAEERMVVVRGNKDAKGVVVASDVSFEVDYGHLRSMKSVEIIGFVQDPTTRGQFYLDSLPVVTNAATQHLASEHANPIWPNHRVRVKGALNDQNVLVAQELEYLPAPEMQMNGRIESITDNSITVGGLTFYFSPKTLLAGPEDKRIKFDELRVDDVVYISGFAHDGGLNANSLALDNRNMSGMTVERRGPVVGINKVAGSFDIIKENAATTITINGQTEFARGSDGVAFFTSLRCGDYIYARGYENGPAFYATYVKAVSPQDQSYQNLDSAPQASGHAVDGEGDCAAE